MIDRQKVYNRVRKHLLTQMEKSVYDGSCKYRAYDPSRKKVLKCALGCLIPFRHYTPTMEGGIPGMGRVDDVISLSIKDYRVGIDDGKDMDFLRALQEVHDEYDPHTWEVRLDRFAEEHGLEVRA